MVSKYFEFVVVVTLVLDGTTKGWAQFWGNNNGQVYKNSPQQSYPNVNLNNIGVSDENVEWICRNPKTDDVMIIAAENGPTPGQQSHLGQVTSGQQLYPNNRPINAQPLPNYPQNQPQQRFPQIQSQPNYPQNQPPPNFQPQWNNGQVNPESPNRRPEWPTNGNNEGLLRPNGNPFLMPATTTTSRPLKGFTVVTTKRPVPVTIPSTSEEDDDNKIEIVSG